MNQNLKSDLDTIKHYLYVFFEKGAIFCVAFGFWRFTLGHFYPVAGTVVGVATGFTILFFMLVFQANKLPFEDLPDEEVRSLKDGIIVGAAFKAGKRLCRAYTGCNLTRAIDTEFIDPTTGDKYRLIFRRMRNGERMQAPHMREPLQAPKETEKDIFFETDGDWQPGQYQTGQIIPHEDKTGSIEATTANKGVHEIAEAVFRTTPPMRN